MYHLAQLNIARMTMPYEDARMQDFIDSLDPVNQLADSSPGFVWRMVSENNTDQELLDFEAEGWLVNMSVWQDLDSLKSFITAPLHLSIMKRRSDWFGRVDEATMVLWWIPAGHTPTFSEAIQRLEHLRENGPGPNAFSFSSPQDKPSLEREDG